MLTALSYSPRTIWGGQGIRKRRGCMYLRLWWFLNISVLSGGQELLSCSVSKSQKKKLKNNSKTQRTYEICPSLSVSQQQSRLKPRQLGAPWTRLARSSRIWKPAPQPTSKTCIPISIWINTNAGASRTSGSCLPPKSVLKNPPRKEQTSRD